ncbi:MAG: Hydroxyethylthiazole kinase [Acidobacteria bacterium ADurb.Bin340]|nr:MAG: Hydroxyethylthiazole kinase [Acidobacteria bacterium ADurb.Bin340]HOD33664.1 hydroxyethylthiazole kinase [Holophaga sp.]HQL48494.1 hydroxyethylthiazole kinase [Holophaga sp.]
MARHLSKDFRPVPGPLAQRAWETLLEIRARGPLVHNITNHVVMNLTANALLTLGASPVMAHAEEEVEEMASVSAALVLNLGTLSPAWVRAMQLAAGAANRKGIPIVLDPVGAGATAYRTRTALELLERFRPSILRANASEVLSLVGSGQGKGVDSGDDPEAALSAALRLNESCGCVVCISGAVDLVSGPSGILRIPVGHPMMGRVTGMGCTATALCGAFAAVDPDPAAAAASAMSVMGVAGSLAAERAAGPGSFVVHFLDALHRLTLGDLSSRLPEGN